MRKLMFLFGAGLLVAVFALPALGASLDNGTTTTTTTPGTTTAATTTAATTTSTTPTTTTTTTVTTPAAPALPNGRRAHLHWFAGSVSSVGDASLTVGVLWTGPNDGSLNGQTLTVSVPSNTRINGPHHGPIALARIQAGDLVSVLAAGDGSSSLTAARIHVYCNCHWVGGTISQLGSDSLSIQVGRTGPYDTVLKGQNVTIHVNAYTVYLRGPHRGRIAFSDLQVGEGVGVVFSADGFFKAPGFNPATANFTAKRIHVWGHRQVPGASTDVGSAAATAAS